MYDCDDPERKTEFDNARFESKPPKPTSDEDKSKLLELQLIWLFSD
jgi:hypothetical protein